MEEGNAQKKVAVTTASAIPTATAVGSTAAVYNPGYSQQIPNAVALPNEPGVNLVTVVYVAAASVPEKMSFLRKVFGTLSIQLLVTFAIVLLCFIPGCAVENNTQIDPNCTDTSFRDTILESPWIFWVVLGVWIVLYIACVCTQIRFRKPPTNYIILSIFTVGTGIFLGVLSCFSSFVEVVIAVALTLLIAWSLIGLTCCSFMNGFVGPAPYIAVAVLSVFWTCCLFVPSAFGMSWYTYYNVLWSGCGVLIFSLFIIWDTTRILSGAHRKIKFGFGDHCTAALSLYLDIVNLFICLLSGGRR
jgi:FtsH-binding integral membrane protein